MCVISNYAMYIVTSFHFLTNPQEKKMCHAAAQLFAPKVRQGFNHSALMVNASSFEEIMFEFRSVHGFVSWF